MDARLCFFLVLVFVFFVHGGSGSRTSTKGCILVSCKNGSALLPMNKSIIDERKDCENDLYNGLDQFVGGADKSDVIHFSCDSEIETQKITLKIDCHDKTRDFKTCFKIQGNPKKSFGDEHKNEHLFLLVLLVLVVLVVVAAAVGIRYWRNRDGNRNAAAV